MGVRFLVLASRNIDSSIRQLYVNLNFSKTFFFCHVRQITLCSQDMWQVYYLFHLSTWPKFYIFLMFQTLWRIKSICFFFGKNDFESKKDWYFNKDTLQYGSKQGQLDSLSFSCDHLGLKPVGALQSGLFRVWSEPIFTRRKTKLLPQFSIFFIVQKSLPEKQWSVYSRETNPQSSIEKTIWNTKLWFYVFYMNF